MMRRWKVSVGIAPLFALSVAVTALAYFTSFGVGSGVATVGKLASPSPVSATAGTGSAHVTWQSVPSPSGAASDVTLSVGRSFNGGDYVPAGGSCAGALSDSLTSCDDSIDAAGTYTFMITAHFRTWTSNGTSNSITLGATSNSQVVTIDGKANIFGAGHALPPAPAGGGGGQLPPTVNFAAAGSKVITIRNVSGSVGSGCGGAGNSADGYHGQEPGGCTYTNINSTGGIAGIFDSRAHMFLVGVFLDANEPADPAPTRLDFSPTFERGLGEDYATLSPGLRQVFFVGDGLIGSGTGAQQEINPPAGATRLFLGFADGFAFRGDTGYYDDNTGVIQATVNVDTPPPGGHFLRVSTSGIGSGTVAGSGISCPGVCRQSYNDGANVTLTATPASGSTFVGWSGDCTGTPACDLTMDGDKTVAAAFAKVQRSLVVSTAGDGSGSVIGSGINCPGACSHSYDDGTLVGLTATPTPGSRFAGWSGDCAGVSPCNLTMDGDKIATATFIANQHVTVYGVNPFENDSAGPGLLSFDAADGHILSGQIITIVGGPLAGTVTGANGLAKDPQSGRSYATLQVSGVTGRVLASIDLSSGQATTIGNTGANVSAITFSSDGTLFAVTGQNNSCTDCLYMLDKTSARKTFIENLPNKFGVAIAYNPRDGMIYHASGSPSTLEKIDPANAYAVTNVGYTGSTPDEVRGMGFDPSTGDFVMTDGRNVVWSVTPAGATTRLSSMTQDVRGLIVI